LAHFKKKKDFSKMEWALFSKVGGIFLWD